MYVPGVAISKNASVLTVCLVVALALAGCARPDAGSQRDDVLRVALPTFSDGTFLPWNGSTGRKPYLDTIYEYLVYLDPQTHELQPGLAERWQVAADGRSVTLWLREGIQFHDGWGEFGAADVKYTLDRIRDRSSIAGIASTFRYAIRDVHIIDAHTVRIELNHPDIEFIAGYLSNGVNAPMVSRQYVETVGDEAASRVPVGTGPYRLAAFQEDTLIEVAAANDGHGNWRVQPEFSHIRFLSVPEEFSRAAMLKTGEADIAPINYDSIDALERFGLRTFYVEGNWVPVVRFGGLSEKYPNADVPWQDVRVRQALNYAVDKEAIVKHILHGQAAIVPGDFGVPEWRDIPPYPYDPERARQLLASAGYPDGFEMTLRTFATSPGAELPIIAEAVTGFWREVGVRARIVPTTWTSLRTAWSSGKTTDIAWTHRGLAFASTLQGLVASIHSSSLFSTFTNAHTAAEVDAIGMELDAARRSQRIRDLGVYLRDQAASVFIGYANEPYAVSDRVGNWPALNNQWTNLDLVTRGAR